MASLYERLGGTEGITQIVRDLVALHKANPAIAPRFAPHEDEKLVTGAASFFIAGTGGPNNYQGRDMLATHANMNISDEEFNAVLDDTLEALRRNSIGQREQEEVLFILYSMKKEVVHV